MTEQDNGVKNIDTVNIETSEPKSSSNGGTLKTLSLIVVMIVGMFAINRDLTQKINTQNRDLTQKINTQKDFFDQRSQTIVKSVEKLDTRIGAHDKDSKESVKCNAVKDLENAKDISAMQEKFGKVEIQFENIERRMKDIENWQIWWQTEFPGLDSAQDVRLDALEREVYKNKGKVE